MKTGADIDAVSKVTGFDKRIGKNFESVGFVILFSKTLNLVYLYSIGLDEGRILASGN